MDQDTQDPFGLHNLSRQQLLSKEDTLVRLGRQADIYQKLTASLAPSIWEMDDVKKGILCQLFGSVNKVRSARIAMLAGVHASTALHTSTDPNLPMEKRASCASSLGLFRQQVALC